VIVRWMTTGRLWSSQINDCEPTWNSGLLGKKGDYSTSLLHLIPNLGSNSDRYIKIYNGHHSPAESRKQKAGICGIFQAIDSIFHPSQLEPLIFIQLTPFYPLGFYIYIYMEKMKKKHLLNNVCSINFKLEELCI
jgi:hypothetical protein